MRWATRWTLTVLSAVLLLACYPNGGWMPHGLGWVAWFALVPLYVALLGGPNEAPLRPRHVVLISYVSAFLFLGANCYWIAPCMHNYGDLNWGFAALALVIYAAILAFWYGLTGWCLGCIAQRSRMWALVAAPFLWVTAELLRSRVSGIPWDYLGQSQVDAGVTRSIAPVAGVIGISFLVAGINAAFTAAVLLRSRRRWKMLVPYALLGAFILIASFDGTVAIPAGRSFSLALLLQPNEKLNQEGWAVNGFDRNMQAYGELMRGAFAADNPAMHPSPTTVIIWPESPAPLSENDPRFRDAVSAFAKQYSAPMIVGNTAEERISPEPGAPPVRAFFNSASFVTPDGNFAGRYDKIHLVPFGEYVPHKNFLAFLHNLTQGAGDLTPGHERKVFRYGGHAFGTFICYESVFPEEVREFANNGADVLVNISDDAWYGDTSAPWQHLDQTRMRAIENHKWVLLDTNNGVTASIDPNGTIVAAAPRKIATAVRVPFAFVPGTTFYSRHGDWFAWLSAAVSLLITIAMAIRSKVAP